LHRQSEESARSVLIASVLVFCAGVCVQAVNPLPLAPLLISTIVGIALAGVLLCVPRRVCPLVAPLILLCFCLSGATRLALQEARQVATGPAEGDDVYEGLVVESSSTIKVLSLLKPAGLERMRVAFVSGHALETGQTVRIFGRIADLNPSFNNPGMNSWRGLKRLEGVTRKIKGRVLSVETDSGTISRLRRYFKGNIERSGAHRQDVLKALTIGDRAAIPRETTDLFTKSGTAHVLAVSGFNVSVISGFFFFLVRCVLRRFRRWRLSGRDSRYAALLTIPFPFMFMLVAGGGVSLIRATIMASVFLIALFMEKQRHLYNTMALAALAVLLLYPHSLLAPSFLLTFTSLSFIVMFMERFYPWIARIGNRALSWSASTVLSTLAATLGTAPVVVFYFCGINPLCFLHNLVTIPLLGVAATALALAGMVVPAGHQLLMLAGYIADANIAILRAFDFGYLYPLIRPTLGDALLYYALVVGALYAHRKPVAVLLCVVIVPLAALQAHHDYRQRFNEDIRVHFIDVGLGDAALVEAPGGMRILIDGGGYEGSDFDVGKQVITPFLLYRKVRHIDYVVNTHPHADHTLGLFHVLDNFSVSHLVTAGCFPEDKTFVRLAAVAKRRGIDHTVWKKGDRVGSGGFGIEVLHSRDSVFAENLNETSLVLRITYKDVSFLFPGDIENDVENSMILSGNSLKSDVLKIPHHGSARSNCFPFIYAVSPRMAVLSASGVMKGLPSPETLDRYKKASVPVLRTYKDGLVEVWSDGRHIGWKTRNARGSPARPTEARE
jgi:competence protein ComEC